MEIALPRMTHGIQSQAELDLINLCTFFYGTIVIDNITSVALPPALKIITGQLQIIGPIHSIEADGLTELKVEHDWDGTPSINGETIGNGAGTPLSKLSFPKLTHLRVLDIQYLTGLQTVDGFPALSRINSGVYVNGTYSEVLFPNLTHVGGELSVVSTNSNFQCPFLQEFSNGVLESGNRCTCGYVNNLTTGIATAPSTSTSSPSATKHLGISCYT